MLLNTVILPPTMEPLPEDGPAQKAFCNAGIGLLYDLAVNCLVLVDQDGTIEYDLRGTLEKWPPKFQPRAQELIKRLYKSNRFVPVRRRFENSVACSVRSCKVGVEIAKTSVPHAVFAAEDCQTCAPLRAGSASAVGLHDYQTSEFNEVRRALARGYTVHDGEWTQEEFERRILRPVFAHAKHVKVIDRYIGRSIRYGRMKEGYRRSLDWLLRVFKDSTSRPSARSFEVYCGMFTAELPDYRAMSPEDSEAAQDALRRFVQTRRDGGHPLSVTIHEEEPGVEMPHGRYLHTDQFALMIERGFDLLWTDRDMRNKGLDPASDPRPVKGTSVTLCPDPEGVESSVQRLKPLLRLPADEQRSPFGRR